MSIDMYVSCSQQQALGIASCRDRRETIYFQLKAAIFEFVSSSKELEGQAYTSAKKYYQTVLLPLVEGGQLLALMVAEATDNFPKEYIAQVDSGDLKESELVERIAELDALIHELKMLRQDISDKGGDFLGNEMRLKSYELIKWKLERKLKKLYRFDASSPSIFDGIESLKVSLAEGLACTQDAWDSQRGIFVIPPPVKMQWVTSIRKMQIEIYGHPDVYRNAYNLYGGRQRGPSDLYDTTKDPTIEKIVRKYHPDMSEKDIHTFLEELNSKGCGYIACVNTFLNQYSGSEEDFEQEFGFPLYRMEDGRKRLNFEYLLVDFYAGCNKLGRPKGTNQKSRDKLFTKYLNDHGVDVSFENGIDATIDNYKEYSKEGQVIISVDPVRMINAANGEYKRIDAGHAMTVTGTKVIDGVEYLVVSSWGEKFYLNPAEYGGWFERCEFQVVSYD